MLTKSLYSFINKVPTIQKTSLKTFKKLHIIFQALCEPHTSTCCWKLKTNSLTVSMQRIPTPTLVSSDISLPPLRLTINCISPTIRTSFPRHTEIYGSIYYIIPFNRKEFLRLIKKGIWHFFSFILGTEYNKIGIGQ